MQATLQYKKSKWETWMSGTYTLYGMAASLYTGKVRAYLRHNHIPFVEEKVGGDRFNTSAKPAVGRWIIPVLETPEGDFVQDGSVILDYLDAKGLSKRSIFPKDPRLTVITHVFELFGGEGLLRPAMHYRWNFDETNLSFLKASFQDVMPNGLSDEEREGVFEFASGRMRKATGFFGVTPVVHDAVETGYLDFLARLNTHLSERPFLLGGYPTHGDYGLFNALYAHLGRDPKPLQIMQTHAPYVYRWTERMNAPEQVNDERALKSGPDLIVFEDRPESLSSLLAYIAEDYLPELVAHIDFANDWLANGAVPMNPNKPHDRTIGMCTFKWRDHEISTAVMTYRFYLLQRIQDAYDGLSDPNKSDIDAMFSAAGLADILTTRTTRRVYRKDHMEYWADA
jgi:glutathione S-transferase